MGYPKSVNVSETRIIKTSEMTSAEKNWKTGGKYRCIIMTLVETLNLARNLSKADKITSSIKYFFYDYVKFIELVAGTTNSHCR